MTSRLNPFDAVFGPTAEERFPVLRQGLESAGRDGRDREAFVLVREVVELLRELRPTGTEGGGVDELVGFLHAAYLFWVDGLRTVVVDRETLDDLVANAPEAESEPTGRVYYIQLAPQRVWGKSQPGAPIEPLDGWFAAPRAGELEVVAVFGFHPTRDGLTVVTIRGPKPGRLVRPDRSALFSPGFDGALAAGLWQVLGGEEVLELAYRCHALLPPGGVPAGVERVNTR